MRPQQEQGHPESAWDWATPAKLLADVDKWSEEYSEVQERTVSKDGERVAAIVKGEDESFTVYVNETTWSNAFEKIWSLQFSPNGRLFCIAMNDDQWTVVQDDEPWDESFDYIWNLRFSEDGAGVAANIRTPEGYGISLNGKAWEKKFVQMRSCEISPDGLHSAGNVQTKPVPEGDIFTFKQGVWSLAIDGDEWPANFLNVWNCALSGDGASVAAEVRLDTGRQTVAVDGIPWNETFNAVWEPLFVPGSHDAVAPCLTPEGWKLLVNGKPI